MARIYLCFLWHMHQPFYKDLISGKYHLPWTRLHGLKDYYGMAHVLEEFPAVRQTFNLVPSMMVQVDEYARGVAADPFLECAMKPAEELTDDEKDFLLRQFFLADPQHLIYRYPRYGELYDAWMASGRDVDRTRRLFGTQGFRDLQVLSQLAWFDEEALTGDAELRALVKKGRNFASEDQALTGRKERELLAMVLPEYRRLSQRGQIEISTTPYYHPILPLLCDSSIAAVSHPGVPLPSRFRYPGDARRQLEMAREFVGNRFGAAPRGLWPSEGSVSDEVFAIAAETGFAWAATDSGVLDRTLGRGSGVEGLYRPYLWQRDGRSVRVIFRDHFLSDLIGFVYARLSAPEAAGDFLQRIHDNCAPLLAQGRDALVPIILDGENAWEYYDQNGRPFLRELYRRISADPAMTATTVSEALQHIEPDRLDHIFPGSWINANFDVWIGAEEDNKAWEYLLRARETYDRVTNVPEDRRSLAYEELLIAEGSDWCWWYGPEHHSVNREEFDQLYRDHLANVYRALNLHPPDELSRPILKTTAGEFRLDPTGFIRPKIDGEVSSYFEWLGAGIYRLDERSGAMHGRRGVVKEMGFGTDGENLYFRLDFRDPAAAELADLEIRVCVRSAAATSQGTLGWIRAGAPEGFVAGEDLKDVRGAFRRIFEAAIPLASVGAAGGPSVSFQISLWRDGLPLEALPQQQWLELVTTAPAEWTG